jgi:hypothetical protein
MPKILTGISRLWRFAFAMRDYLREFLTEEQVREYIDRHIVERSRSLLSIVKRGIYDNPGSPYLKLLGAAGCEYGDFENLVTAEGVEGALEKIAAQGVYVTVDEIKGKKEIRRGSATFSVLEKDFDNPLRTGHIAARSGASRSAGTRIFVNLDDLADNWAIHQYMRYQAWGVHGFPLALWLPVLPGGGALSMLARAKSGSIPEKWFSPVERTGFKPSRRNRVGTLAIVYAGRLWGVKLPKPEYTAFDEAIKVAAWMRDAIRREGGCSLVTYTSAGVRVCQAARREGWKLNGAVFFVTGEPTTEAKWKEISAAGARVCPSYVFMEGGIVGVGCLNPAAVDDCHFFTDSHALTTSLREIPHLDVTVRSYRFTTLLESSPKILLNAENGDFGEAGERACGCPLEKAGLPMHIWNIRSFEKLTGEGMSFIGTDVIRIVEQVLPTRFGGDSTSYQFLEEEDESGFTRLTLLVSPAVGAVDESKIVETVIAELGNGEAKRMAAEIWSKAGTLRVRRAAPIPTERGKFLPLHIARRG